MLTLAIVVLCVACTTLDAGPINPPAGPVAPTPGPEPRTAINSTNTPGDSGALYIISSSGSYYLTGNITTGGRHVIEIAPSASDVTIDLIDRKSVV